MRPRSSPSAREHGITLVELMVVLVILASVMVGVTGILLGSRRLHSRTLRRAEVQAESRQALNIMVTEVRQARADPSFPSAGIAGIVLADSTRLHVRGDVSANGTIETTEPSEDVAYAYDAGSQTITRDPGSGPAVLIAGVTSLRFTYFDDADQPLLALPLSAADAAMLRTIGITFVAEDRDSHPITLTTRVALRNQ